MLFIQLKKSCAILGCMQVLFILFIFCQNKCLPFAWTKSEVFWMSVQYGYILCKWYTMCPFQTRVPFLPLYAPCPSEILAGTLNSLWNKMSSPSVNHRKVFPGNSRGSILQWVKSSIDSGSETYLVIMMYKLFFVIKTKHISRYYTAILKYVINECLY